MRFAYRASAGTLSVWQFSWIQQIALEMRALKWTLPRFAIVLAVALTAWLWPSIFGGKVLLPLDILAHSAPFSPESPGPIHNELIGDMVAENFAWKTFQKEAVLNGEWPLWTPYSFCGHPIYTTGQTSTFYPLNVLFFVMPIAQAYVAFTWIHLFLGGLFAYLFFRRVGVSGFGASVGAIMFAMCAYFGVRFIWPMLLGSAIWLPLMLLWIDWIADARSLRSLAWGLPAGAVLFAMPLLSGFFEIAFYVYFACGLYTLFLGLRTIYRDWSVTSGVAFFAKVGGMTALAVVLSLPQLLPFFEVMKRNVRAGELTYEDAIKNGLTLQDAISFAVPDALGNPSDHNYFDVKERQWKPIQAKNGQDFHYFGPINYVEGTNYLGLLPLAFVVLSPLAAGRRRLFFWALLAVSLALAFATPAYWFFFHFVPGTDQVRTPFRWTLITMFACTYLAAIGADDWYRRLAEPARPLTKVVATGKLVVMFLIALAVVALFFAPNTLMDMAARLMAANPRAASVFADPTALASLLWVNAARFAVFALGAMVLLTLAYWRAWGSKSIALFSFIALAWVAFDLGQATYRFNTHADPKIAQQVPPMVEHMRADAQKDTFRIYRFGWQKMFAPNFPTLCGLQEVGGYDSIILKDYARYMGAIEFLKLLPYNIVSSFEHKPTLESPLFALLNVRYLVAVEPIKHPNVEQVNVPGNLLLYRVKPDKEMPRAFLVNRVERVFDLDEAIDLIKSGKINIRKAATVQTPPGGTSHLVDSLPGKPGQAKIASYGGSRVQVETSTPSQQLLVLSDMYYPGWRAYVDGHPTDIIRTNGVFRGVSVPAGDHKVEFRFEPKLLQFGGALSLACLAGLVIAMVVGLVLSRKTQV